MDVSRSIKDSKGYVHPCCAGITGHRLTHWHVPRVVQQDMRRRTERKRDRAARKSERSAE